MNVRKTFKLFSLLLIGLGVASCSDNDSPEQSEMSAKETALKNATEAYINHTVLPTYKGMADAAIKLYDNCETISDHHAAGIPYHRRHRRRR